MSFVGQHRAATAVGVVSALVASIVVVVALSSDGYESRHVDLNDGGIWVTSNSDGLFGRLNKPAGSLDLALNPPGGAQSSYRLDVRQSGSAVTAWDQSSGKLLPVDVASGKAVDDQGVPVSADQDVELAGGTVAVLDAAVGNGKVWAEQVDPARSIGSLAEVEPSAKAAVVFPKRADGATRAAALAVGSNGTLYAANSSGDVAVAAQSGVRFAKPTFSRVAGRLQSVQVTAVGSQVVVLDAQQGRLYLPGGKKVTIPASPDDKLQAPSDGGDTVVVATRTGLLSAPLSGGQATTLYSGANGRPAQPTWLGDCVHAAWAGEPGVYARACGGDVAKRIGLPSAKALEDPVFRVNRGSILLNDLSLGNIYDLDTLQEVDNWSAVKPPPLVKASKKNKDNTNSQAARDQPPKAVDDTWGARPGRTTVVHVLDNDSDPQGAILSIQRVSAVSDRSAAVTIAPDGQSVEVTLPATGARDVRFKYTIDDGRGKTADADVEVQVRADGQNEAPRKRVGFTQTSFTASSGGTLDLPVLDDWRDFDGDPLVITTAKVEGTARGTVTIAPSGRLNFVAPATGGNATIGYQVSDGSAQSAAQQIPVTVLAPTSDQTAAPVAEPDIARGQVGKPIELAPLANDLPGADPTNPNAELGIAGTVASPAGVKVDTDLKSGKLSVTATRPGTFALSYTASYGNAKFDHAPIRVDVAAAPASAQPPVAVPDTGVLYGQTAATIDVLANDYDPAGGVLVVQRAVAADPDQLEVSVLDGRFLRVGARRPDLAVNPQVVRYTITNGLTAPVSGELTVTQVPPPADDTPLAVDDYATVRSGDSVLVPVLDNDIDPAGASLALLDDVPNAPTSGALTVIGGDGARSGVGAAFVSDKQVRYAAPAVTRSTEATITYVVRNPGGDRATGTVHVTVTPPPSAKNPNQPPAAEPIDARAISGQTVRIKIPTTGVDPDGDTANVVGISAAPTLGRVVTIGATSITYEAFPTTSGTDRFGYIISDKYGKTSRSTIAVGVAQVSDPQPPTAVDDTITASPGAKVRVDALANDVIAPDDSVSIGDLGALNTDLPTRVKRVASAGPIQITAPAQDGGSVNVLYSVTDGSGDPSVATITVRSQRGYVPPPNVSDVPAAPRPGAASATVDVLATASDPQDLTLSVAKVYDPKAIVAGGKVTVPVTAQVQNIVYAVRNTDGATAAAVIHVPARGTGLPYAKPGQLIRIGLDGDKTIDIGDYVINPNGKPVRLTTADQLSAAPGTGLRLSSPDPTHLKLQGVGGYNGPAAITFEITDGSSLNDPKGQQALITVQVQVGPNTPVVRCPSAPLTVVEGGVDRRLDIGSLCHVWLADRSQLGDLQYTASWTSAPQDVAILGSGSGVIGLRAGGTAKPGQTGRLRIQVEGTNAKASYLNVTVTKLGRASMSPIRIDGFKAGATATRDIRGSVDSPQRSPQVSVVRILQSSGMPARVTFVGSRVSITPGRDSHGVMTFDLVATDIADKARKDRQFTGRITLEVLNVPDRPGTPQTGRTVLSQTVVLSWPTPAANGAQIDRYQVGWSGGSQTCAASPCRITGLTNGRKYTFTVRAHNAVGFSKPSASSPAATPNKRPAAVTNLRTSNPQDHAITVSWTPVNNGGTAPTSFRVSWSGGGSAGSVPGTARSVVARGLDNHNVYSFTVVAVNSFDAGPANTTRGQSAGTPATPTGVTVAYADAAGTDARAVKVNWNASDPNGPTPATYTVTRDGTAICADVTRTTCNDTPATGKTYTYRVVASNDAGKASPAGSVKFVVAGTPDQPTDVRATPTDTDGQLTVSYTVPNSHGQQPKIKCTSSTNGSCGEWTPPAAGQPDSRPIGGLNKDADVVITLQPCNEQNCGAPASAPSAHTSGPPRAPAVDCQRTANGVRFTWNGPGGYNGHAIKGWKTSLDGGGYSGTTTAQSRDAGDQDGKSHTLRVISVDSRNEDGTDSGSATCTDPPKPDPPTVTVIPGDWTRTVPGCTNVGCHAVDVTLRHFQPNQRVSFYRKWAPSDDDGVGGNMTVTVDGNGYWHGIDQYYGGGSGGGAGHGYVSIYVTTGSSPSDTCTSDWHVESDHTCD